MWKMKQMENSVEMKKMTDLGIMHDIILLNDKNIKKFSDLFQSKNRTSCLKL